MSTTPIEPLESSGEDRPGSVRGLLRTGLPRPRLGWMWWLPVALGGVYAVLILTHLRTIVDSIGLSSDSDIDAVLAHMGMHAPAGALLTTGDYPHYETMAFTLLTRSLPFYRDLWVLAPVFFGLVGFGAVIWSAWRAFGRWPAAVVAAVLVCFGGGLVTLKTGGLATIFAMDAHANSLITAAVVGAGLVWVVPRIGALSDVRLVAAAVVLGVLGGLPLAGDTLYLAWGVAPLALVTLLAAWRGPQDGALRVIAFGAGTLLATGLTAVLFGSIMHAAGVRDFAWSYRGFTHLAGPRQLGVNLQTLLRALPSLTAGSFYGQRADSRTELELASAVLLFAALIGGVWSVRRRVANALPRPDGGGEVVGARFVHTVFWVTVLAAGIAVFMIGTPNPVTTTGRYLLGPYVAVAALLPLMLERGPGWRLAVTAGASLFIFSAIYQWSSGLRQLPAGFQPASTARELAAFAKREHVSVGYGSYWNSLNYTWESGFKVAVFPIQRCKTDPDELCTFSEISISSWDRPHAGVARSMLVTDPTDIQVHTRAPQFGKPLTSAHIGDLIVYVYPYDIATRLRYEAGLTL